MQVDNASIRFLGMRNPKKVKLSVTNTESEMVDIIIPESLVNNV
eukprot:CAMPEP_0116924990 /NCGR_PEP_ID=MMETSP0467-20121206/23860_1 /TAXON_ID=283647 /ORGANISM="Mesodinium pulex, Strain SPMC105" /LENGTH=43 /DNA_ID= /DNA_START= /DNA_END= /DNA_ORIENTATION=